MPDIPACEVTFKNGMADDLRVKRRDGTVPVKFNPGLKKLQEETKQAASSVRGSLADLPGPVDDMPVSKKDIVEDNGPWNF